jgi:DNA-binding NarL/FixJ family response regulator
MSSAVITVALVEDNPGLRASLETLLNRASGIRCLGAFADGEQALRELPALRPQVVLMDINLPGLSGVQCVAPLAGLLPGTHIVMLTVYDNTDAIFASLEAGACGYLLKPARAAQLVAAIKEVAAGGAPMSSSIARRVVQTFKKTPTVAEKPPLLAAREREILDLLSQGLLQKEIAEQLGISYWTVQTHIGRIYEKLHVHSRAQAVAKYCGAKIF